MDRPFRWAVTAGCDQRFWAPSPSRLMSTSLTPRVNRCRSPATTCPLIHPCRLEAKRKTQIRCQPPTKAVFASPIVGEQLLAVVRRRPIYWAQFSAGLSRSWVLASGSPPLSQVGLAQVCLVQDCLVQVRLVQACPARVRLSQVRPAEICRSQIRRGQVCLGQIAGFISRATPPLVPLFGATAQNV